MSFKYTSIGKIRKKWDIIKLSNCTTKITDGTHGTVKDNQDGDYYLLSCKNIKNGKIIINENERKIDKYTFEKLRMRTKLAQNDILITTVGTIGETALVKEVPASFEFQRSVAIITSNKNLILPEFLYYAIKDYRFQSQAQGMIKGSVQKCLFLKEIGEILIPRPSLEEQKAIANILSTLDEKIEVNNQINKKLEEMAQAIFKRWFVDFEFPDENGNPYKSSGGEMIESEIGLIPKGWEVRKLEEFIELFDSKRVPLSSREREKREKIYPYYGAASLMDYVDDYLFDGIYVLIGEDGTVIDENGFPILQYVWGKFWVNNHAHVVKGKNSISEEFIYILLKHTKVSSAVTGAVQLKINQQNLKSLKVVLPKDDEIITNYSNTIKNSFMKLRNNVDENKILIKLRDTLLPKLMSGEIRVPVNNENND